MQDGDVSQHTRIELLRFVRQVLQWSVRAFERMNPSEHLKRNDCKGKPV
jgi:hypothetical protein